MSRPLLLVAPLAALAFTACVDNNADSGLTVLRNVVPATGCVLDPSEDSFRSSGVIQSNAANGYYFTPVVRNDLVIANGASETQQTIFVEGARVTIAFYDTDFFSAAELTQLKTDGVTQFRTPTSGSIDPDGGVATFGYEIVPPALLQAIDARLPDATPNDLFPATLLDVTVQMYGTRAGSAIESNTFHYPIEVCDGCLFENVGACSALPSDFTGGSGGACNVPQDGVLQCCTEASGLVCPAKKSTTQT